MYQSLKENHEKPDFSHVGENSRKLKSQLKKLYGRCQKETSTFRSWDSKSALCQE